MRAAILCLLLILGISIEASAYTKPPKVTDEEWKAVLGPHAAETYRIVKGDSLSAISKILFGDWKYWPKIWAVNNSSIVNPDLIYPDNVIHFTPGTIGSLPSVAVTSASGGPAEMRPSEDENAGEEEDEDYVDERPDAALKRPVKSKHRSQEWRHLAKQPWENVTVKLPPEVDPLGFDRSTAVPYHRAFGIELQAIASTQEIASLGEITGSRSPSVGLSINDLVFIKTSGELQLNEIYSITRDPSILKSPRMDRVGYSYLNVAKVQIVGVNEGLYIGQILTAGFPVNRGDRIMPLVGRIPIPEPIPAENPMRATLLIDHGFSTYTTAQHRQVFVDRGTEDGIAPGMVFRGFVHYDPATDDKITSSDFLPEGDVIVVQVSERFSSCIVLNSTMPINEDTPLTLLTDVTDLYRHLKQRGSSSLDELDQLDTGGPLRRKEAKELKQLEKWKENPPSPLPEPSPVAPPSPEAAPSSEPVPAVTGEAPPPPSPAPAPEAIPPTAPEPPPLNEQPPAGSPVPPTEQTAPAAPTSESLPPNDGALVIPPSDTLTPPVDSSGPQ